MRYVVLAVLGVGVATAGLWWLLRDGGPATGTDPTAAPVPAAETGAPDVLVIGGGGIPETTQVSIEQDVALATQVLGGPSRVLFSGGPGTHVQVLADEPRGDPLIGRLARFFAPRQGRDARYRPTTLPVVAPATHGAVTEHLAGALEADSDPLMVVMAGHGDRGETPAGNVLALWAGGLLSARDFTAILDEHPERPVRLVNSMCFGGGYAEMIFTGADTGQGPTPSDRCGLFAVPWDLEASGCDPDPDRRAQEGFAVHFFNALRGRDRHGDALHRAQVDFDGDGRISLLEAHARTRIASESFDVPTTTSERWLRQVGPVGGATGEVALPEEDAVVGALSARLGLAGREDEAFDLLEDAAATIASADAALREAEARTDEAWYALAGVLLARWPVLDDPWHPDFRDTVERHRQEIESVLDQAPEAAEWKTAAENADRQDAFLFNLRRKAAPLERLVRSLEIRRMARLLAARGGDDWKVYQRLLTCERHVPPEEK